jgi:hypothetical protein
MSLRTFIPIPLFLTLTACGLFDKSSTQGSAGPTSTASSGTGGGGFGGGSGGSGGGSFGGGSGAGGGSTTVTGLPQVTKNAGMVVASPKLVSMTFSDDILASQKDQAVQTIGATSYWAGLQEYGVGPATALTPVHLPMAGGNPMWTDPQIQAVIDGAIANGAPAADGSTTYVVFLPGNALCNGAGNYHFGYTTKQGGAAYYAVIPQCDASYYQQNTGVGQNATVMQGLTAVLSHELAEGAADPVLDSGYSLPAPPNLTTTASSASALQYIAWAAVLGTGGGEIGDMCAQMPDAWFVSSTTGLGFQRYWSNQAAAAGMDPCVPPAAGAYFNTVPMLTDMVNLGTDNSTAPYPLGEALGIKLSQGQTAMIPLDLVGNIGTVNAIDYTQGGGGDGALKLSIALASNGQVTLTVTVTKQDTMNGFEAGVLVSCTSSNNCWSTDNSLPPFGPGMKLWPFVVAPS